MLKSLKKHILGIKPTNINPQTKETPKKILPPQTKTVTRVRNVISPHDDSLSPNTDEGSMEIEFSLELMEKYGLQIEDTPTDNSQSESPDEWVCRREHKRISSKEILDKKIPVRTMSLATKHANIDLLSNISAGGLQLISSEPKEIGEELYLAFSIGGMKFSLRGEVRFTIENTDTDKKYNIKFLDPPGDQKLALEQLTASIKHTGK
ncbi:MAG: PilZ domain-containing protein [Candidatus Gracilibacteria bacterium]|nr:PilZ domain-containing protein [Candidatus Gracilibacteria bacterium]